MPRTHVSRPRVPGPDSFRTVPASGAGRIESEGALENLAFQEEDFSGLQATLLSFTECRLTRVNLAGALLPRPGFEDVLLISCDLANGKWEQSRLSGMLLQGCRMVGLDLGGALVRYALFQDCNAAFVNFADAGFKQARFEGCCLRNAIFQGADLRGVSFQGCDLGEAQFSFAKLDRADFRGADITGIHVRPEDLKGAIVEPAQAVYLAGLLGLKVMA
jgi:uncharacterized protein YjbI with pentapeptide repeats